MPTRTGPGLGIAGLILAAAALAACSSSTPHKVSTGPVDTSLGGGPSSAGAGHDGPGPVPAPKELQALPLLTATGLPTALGTSVHGFQDDGGTASTYPSAGFISTAETETRLTRFQVSLQSYTNPADATQAYNQLTASGGTPIAGLGDKAMAQVAQQVVVLKGSQVLVVGVNLTSAGNDYLAEHDKSPASVLAALDRPARAAARAIVPQLTGAAVSGSYLQLPAGATDPCAISTKSLATATKQAVTATNAASENRPAQQCDIQIGSSPYVVQTYTSTQAAAAIPATTLAAVYAQDAQVSTPGQRVQTASEHLKAFMNIDTDFTLEVLVTGDPGSNWRATAATAPGETAHQALIRIKNAQTSPISREHCYQLGKEAAMQLVIGMPQSEADHFFTELTDWCSRFPSGR